MRLAIAVLVGSFVLPSAAAAAPLPRHDADIERDVHKAVLGSIYYGVFDSVTAVVHQGDVLLEGSVLRGHARGDLEKRVARVEGVRTVKSNITVQSFSAFDDQLRRQLYRSIYGGTLMPHTTFAAPVRIVVNRGRVTLTGYVNSRVEQAKVGLKARETLAFSVDNQVKLEGDRHAERGSI